MWGASLKEAAAAGPGDVGEGENLSMNPTTYPAQAAERTEEKFHISTSATINSPFYVAHSRRVYHSNLLPRCSVEMVAYWCGVCVDTPWTPGTLSHKHWTRNSISDMITEVHLSYIVFSMLMIAIMFGFIYKLNPNAHIWHIVVYFNWKVNNFTQMTVSKVNIP